MVSVHTVTERKTARHVWQDFKYAFYLIVHPLKDSGKSSMKIKVM